MQSVTIEKNQAGQRLDKFLKKFLPEAGSSFLYKMLRKKNITLNGKKAEGKEILNLGDTVCFFFSDETFAKFTGRTDTESTVMDDSYDKAYKTLKGISVLYEDENILVVNKPAGILTQKASPTDISLNEWLIGYLLVTNVTNASELQTFRPSVCNRLDRNTSGVVLCGKSLEGSQLLSKLIKERRIGKFYHTICIGKLKDDLILEGYLTKDGSANKVTISQKLPEKGGEKDTSYIQTGYHPINTYDNYTLLEVELITGKTHQIRAHLASIGHPIIGDSKYGKAKVNQKLQQETGLKAQLLHAYRVEFPMEDEELPKSLQGKVITAPYPIQFEKIKSKLNL